MTESELQVAQGTLVIWAIVAAALVGLVGLVQRLALGREGQGAL